MGSLRNGPGRRRRGISEAGPHLQLKRIALNQILGPLLGMDWRGIPGR
jgi:hypothetical protein